MMERLTGYNSFGGAYAVGMGCNEYHNNEEIIHKVIERLAAYEDTGLEPGELREMLNEAYDVGVDSVLRDHFDMPWDEAADLRKNIDRLRELARADKDGRVVVLPCKVGAAYFTADRYCTEGGYRTEKQKVSLSDCEWCCEDCDKEIRVTEHRFNNATLILAHEREIGKTVFLTREAAEAALKGGGE